MNDFHLTANLLERYIQKPSDQFTLEDIINFVFEKEIEMINFRYIADDGKLKTLNFVVTGKEELENLLKYGERVNGNAVFSYLNNNHPDLYVIPKFNTAFVNPFSSIPTLDILCSFYTWEGEPLKTSPESILEKARTLFQVESGFDVKLFGELEYYVISEIDSNYITSENSYQASEPFSKFEKIRVEALQTIAKCGGKIRFGHSEQGSFALEKKYYEQHEIEFLPNDPEEAIQQLVIAKWILRMLGNKYNVDISFSPKVAMDKPGNGLHLHFILEKDGINILGDGSDYRKSALQMISGILKHAGSLTAFGNTIPVSYLRLMESQKSPKYICWGPSNRSALIRIPKINMKAINQRAENPKKDQYDPLFIYNQSIEYRGTDASAYLHFFVAALLVAGLDGMNNNNYLTDIKSKFVAENLYCVENIEVRNQLEKLPNICLKAAEKLKENQHLFTRTYAVFPENVLSFVIENLEQFQTTWCQKIEIQSLHQNTISKMIQHFLHYR